MLYSLITSLWQWVKIHTSEKAILFATLVILTLTLFSNIFFEIIKNRKSIRFNRIEVSPNNYNPNNPQTFIQIYFSNNSRRFIRIQFKSLCLINGKSEEDTIFNDIDIQESEDSYVSFHFNFILEDDDLYSIILKDSVGKSYEGYLYRGKFRSKTVVLLLIIKDKITNFLNEHLPYRC